MLFCIALVVLGLVGIFLGNRHPDDGPKCSSFNAPNNPKTDSITSRLPAGGCKFLNPLRVKVGGDPVEFERTVGGTEPGSTADLFCRNWVGFPRASREERRGARSYANFVRLNENNTPVHEGGGNGHDAFYYIICQD